LLADYLCSVVIGSIGSAFKEVFKKLEKLQAKQNFSFAIAVGDLFAPSNPGSDDSELSALLRGQINVPLPTYFTVGSHQMPKEAIDKLEQNDGELCPNLYYLGRRGALTTSEGVKIVALGGVLENSATLPPNVNEKYLSQYTEFDARTLAGSEHADILITHQWPKSITDGSKIAVDTSTSPEGQQCLAELCSAVKPRYHFSSAAEFFFEREPFFHLPSEDDPDIRHVTRFLNMGPSQNKTKQKWLYAFSLDPKVPQTTNLPAGTTVTPFQITPLKRRDLPSQQESYSRFSRDDDSGRPRKRMRRAAPGPSECFFCLSNPNVATHLITSIGSDCYLTTAKGPLPTLKTFLELGFPGHMLILPLTHAPTFQAFDDEDSKVSTFKEMQRYRNALHTMLKERSNGQLGAVTWEVSRANGVHIHWQFIPVAAELIDRGLVETAFVVEADKLKYPKFIRGNPEAVSEGGDYFRVWIWKPSEKPEKEQDESAETSLVLPLSRDFRFDLQFGRTVMAKILNLENRINWRDDTQSQEEEAADAEAFKKAFQKFDFSLES
jgi:hypothetical protein